jgi:hypothetical protein
LVNVGFLTSVVLNALPLTFCDFPLESESNAEIEKSSAALTLALLPACLAVVLICADPTELREAAILLDLNALFAAGPGPDALRSATFSSETLLLKVRILFNQISRQRLENIFLLSVRHRKSAAPAFVRNNIVGLQNSSLHGQIVHFNSRHLSVDFPFHESEIPDDVKNGWLGYWDVAVSIGIGQ